MSVSDIAASDVGDLRAFDRVDLASAGACREDAEDAGPGADVEHDVSGPDDVLERALIRLVAALIAKHPAVDG